MSIESKLSGHWTDDELIRHVYGVGPEDSHIDFCQACQMRLSAALARRRTLEVSSSADDGVSYDFLAAQRRRIYAKLTRPVRWQPAIWARRWTSTAATLLVLGGSVLFYEHRHRPDPANDRISDDELAQDVSRVALDSEPRPTAPLQALFDE